MYALNKLETADCDASAFFDPRLVSAGHSGLVTTLDSPGRYGGLDMAKIYDVNEGYGGFYPTYADIKGGDISYYYDSALAVPFIAPLLFDPSSVVVARDYVDPMTSFKPHYERVFETACGDGLTALTDSRRHRQDLMARQMWRRNQTEPLLK